MLRQRSITDPFIPSANHTLTSVIKFKSMGANIMRFVDPLAAVRYNFFQPFLAVYGIGSSLDSYTYASFIRIILIGSLDRLLGD